LEIVISHMNVQPGRIAHEAFVLPAAWSGSPQTGMEFRSAVITRIVWMTNLGCSQLFSGLKNPDHPGCP
jgi:hypothetical protein